MSAAQNYEALRQICFATRKLYEDPLFVPPQDSKIKWLRPHEITDQPKFIADGVSRFDAQQGGLGDYWMVAAMSDLSLDSKLFEKVVPAGQSFEPDVYCGLFRFCFWRFGRWVQVIIDDRLPVHSRKTPMYVRSSDPSEFWSGLLEKAYAKLYCSYEALTGGNICEAMVDFTGCLAERYDLGKTKEDMWTILKKSSKRGSVMSCSIIARSQNKKVEGLVAYNITDLTEICVDNSTIPLLHLKNPHGQGGWNGVWSDQSHKWSDISESERKRIGLADINEDDFWISLHDWIEKFNHCEICHFEPNSIDTAGSQRWYSKQLEGNWLWGISSGGHLTPSNAKQFAANPQYFVHLSTGDVANRCTKWTMVVSLMNKNSRSAQRQRSDLSITKGFYIFPVRESVSPAWRHLDEEFFRKNQPLEINPIFTMDREATSRYCLDPGIYVIVPSAYDAGEEGDFLLRIWSEHEVIVNESRRSSNAPDRDLLASPRLGQEIVNKPKTKYDNWTRTLSGRSKPLRKPRRSLSVRYTNEEYRLTRSDNTVYVTQRSDDQYPGKPRIVNYRNCYASSRLAAIPIRVTYADQPQHQKTFKSGLLRALFSLKTKNHSS